METEAKIQSDIVRSYNNKYCLAHYTNRCLIMSIPNGGERSVVTGILSVSTGEYKGASDLLVIHFGKIFFIEVKSLTGVQSKNQKLFQQHIEQCGFPYHIVRSVEEFNSVLDI